MRPLDRAIAVAVSVARSTVQLCLTDLRSGAELAAAATLTEQGLRRCCSRAWGLQTGQAAQGGADWAAVIVSCASRRDTSAALGRIPSAYGGGYGYSAGASCTAVGRRGCRRPCDRCTRGERLFVDYTGQTVEVVDGSTGELRAAQVFVAVLGASNYTYAEASWTQSLPDWIGSHVRTLDYWAACRARSCRTICAWRAAGELV